MTAGAHEHQCDGVVVAKIHDETVCSDMEFADPCHCPVRVWSRYSRLRLEYDAENRVNTGRDNK